MSEVRQSPTIMPRMWAVDNEVKGHGYRSSFIDEGKKRKIRHAYEIERLRRHVKIGAAVKRFALT
jgi:hypothetical protein